MLSFVALLGICTVFAVLDELVDGIFDRIDGGIRAALIVSVHKRR